MNYRSSRYLILLIIGLFILWRGIFIYFIHPVYALPGFEPLYRGLVAKELLLGTPLSLLQYRVDSYAGGFYIVVPLTAFFFKFFGPSALSLVSIPLLFSLGALVVWYLILKRQAGEKAALVMASLFIFAPFHFITYSFSNLGDHTETIFISAVTLFLFFEMEFRSKRNWLYYALFGLTAGIGVWFAYIYSITLAAILVFGVLNRSEISIRRRIFTLFFFMVGFSPWLVINFKTHFMGLYVAGVPLWEIVGGKNIASAVSFSDFFAVPLVKSCRVNHAGFVMQAWTMALYILVAFLCFFFAIILRFFSMEKFKIKCPIVKLCVITLVIFLAALQSYKVPGIRFLVPAAPFVFAILACVLSRLIEYPKQWVQRVSTGLWVSLIALGVFSSAQRFSFSHAGSIFSSQGYSYGTFASGSEVLPRLEALARREKPLSSEEFLDVLVVLAGYKEQELPLEEFIKKVPEIHHGNPSEAVDIAYYHLGARCFTERASVEGCLHLFATGLDLQTSLLKYRWALAGILSAAKTDSVDFSFNQFQASVRDQAWRWKGARLIDRFSSDSFSLSALLESAMKEIVALNANERKWFLEGVGSALYQKWLEDPFHRSFKPASIEQIPSPEDRAAIYQGISAAWFRDRYFEFWQDNTWQWNEWSKGMSGAEAEKLEKVRQSFLKIPLTMRYP